MLDIGTLGRHLGANKAMREKMLGNVDKEPVSPEKPWMSEM
jgi:hypothetical protein